MTISPMVMIPLSLISAFLLFHGAYFRYTRHIALFSSSFLTLNLVALIIRESMTQFPTGKELTEAALSMSFLSELLLFISAVIITTLGIRYLKKGIPYILILFSSPLLPLLVNSFLTVSLSISTALIITAVFLVILIISAALWREWTAIIASAVAGGVSLSMLFSQFYYFTFSFTVTLACILIASGVLVQNSTRKKRALQEHPV